MRENRSDCLPTDGSDTDRVAESVDDPFPHLRLDFARGEGAVREGQLLSPCRTKNMRSGLTARRTSHWTHIFTSFSLTCP